MNQTQRFITGIICPAAGHLTRPGLTLFTVYSPDINNGKTKSYLLICGVNVCNLTDGTLLFDLSDLPDGLLEDCAFVRLHVEAVDVGEVGGDELSQLLNVLALLFPPTLVTPAGEPRGLDMLP